ncbi:MAG: TrkA family potassium uptake protein [Bacilli bacterium]|nr:TrkA family potassium uptake protein [Bacilli bacterium]MBN2696424.1 TrkA family potassium uptake protein [Bacilli bacterium]
MQTMLVVGLGRFGRHLALKLAELGNEVMVIDKDEASVNQVAPYVTSAHIGDCMEQEIIQSLGVGNFDTCFVCISDNFQSSLEITWLLKQAGAKRVVSKTDREMHAKFLIMIGADAVIHPERDMAWRTAMKYTSKNIFDYFEFTDEYAIIELAVPNSWVGSTIRALKIREKFNVNIIATKNNGEYYPILNADHVFEDNEHLFLSGSKRDILKLVDR